jgi:hypothetical protein
MLGEESAQKRIDCLRNELRAVRVENRRMRMMFSGLVVLFCLLGATAYLRHPQTVLAGADGDGVIHVRGVVVEDAKGVERLRLGAPLPDPMGKDGVRHARSGAISGLVISDPTGTERGGFATSDKFDEAFLGLDSQKGQEVLFLANPGGGTNLDLFDRAGNEAQITVFPSGPKLVMKKAGQVVAQMPEVAVEAKP